MKTRGGGAGAGGLGEGSSVGRDDSREGGGHRPVGGCANWGKSSGVAQDYVVVLAHGVGTESGGTQKQKRRVKEIIFANFGQVAVPCRGRYKFLLRRA